MSRIDFLVPGPMRPYSKNNEDLCDYFVLGGFDLYLFMIIYMIFLPQLVSYASSDNQSSRTHFPIC